MKCPFCGQEHPDNTKFCPEKGNKIEITSLTCPNCGFTGIPIDSNFCPNCGNTLVNHAKPNILNTSNLKQNIESYIGNQVVFICDGSANVHLRYFDPEDEYGHEVCRVHLKKGKNILTEKEYPLLANGFCFDEDCCANRIVGIDLSNFDASMSPDQCWMFKYCSNIKRLDLTRFKTSKSTDMGFMFAGCSKLISLDVSSFDTSNVSAMWYMFEDCSSLVSLDLSSFDTSNISEMSGMFKGCHSLEYLDLSGWDTSLSRKISSLSFNRETGMQCMFEDCVSLRKVVLKGCDYKTIKSIEIAIEEAGLEKVRIIK